MTKKNKPALPTIVITNRQMRQTTDEALKAVIAANDPPRIFQRGVLTRIWLDENGTPMLQTMTDKAIRSRLGRVADWYRLDQFGNRKATYPPMAVVHDIQSLVEWPGIPVIKGVVESPVFASDGTLVATPGYNPAAKLWLHCAQGFVVPPVVPVPSAKDVRAAVALLHELFHDFPFAEEASRCHAIAAMLLPFCRDLIDGPTPLHLIDAPAPGTGKGLLAQVISIPATGRPAEVMPEGGNDAEWRKRITATLLRAPVFIQFDNIRGRLDSASFAAVLTAPTYTDRVLGYTNMVSIPVRSVWLATGNNVAMSTEMARRSSAWIRLDAGVEIPSQRTNFKHPLPEWAIQNRARIVHACLTIIQAWLAAGRPRAQATCGSYEKWAPIMGGILQVAGVPGFLANSIDLYIQADDEMQPWRHFIDLWWDRYGAQMVGVEELFDIAREHGLLEEVRGGGNTQSQRTKLGLALRTMKSRVLKGFRILPDGTDNHRRQQYRLQPLDDAPASPDAGGTSVSHVGQENPHNAEHLNGDADVSRPFSTSNAESNPEISHGADP
jgi:hypothetical protein